MTKHKCRVLKIDFGPIYGNVRLFPDLRWVSVCDDCKEGNTNTSWLDAIRLALAHYEVHNVLTLKKRKM